MKTNKKICSILLIVMMLFGMASPAFAADTQLNITINSSATYLEVTEGKGFDFLPGFNDKDFNNRYTQTDMFDNFKNVMPGDVLEEDIVVKNGSQKEVNIYMYAVSHSERTQVKNADGSVTETGNPMSDSVVVDAKNNVVTESVAAANGNDIDKMNDFLAQLDLDVSYNDGTKDIVLFDAKANETAGLTSPVALGKFAPNAEVNLDVTLTVPITMGNEFANSVGEVDWVFVVQEVPPSNPPGGGGEPPNTPPPGDNPPPEETFDDPDVPLADLPIVVPGDPVEEIEDFGPPLGDAPPTGDNTNILLYVVLLVAAAFGLKMVRKSN